MRRAFSVLVAVALFVAGHAAIGGGLLTLQQALQGGRVPALAAVLLIATGEVLVAAVALTAVLSGLGVIVVGAVAVVVGAIGATVPPALAPMHAVLRVVDSFGAAGQGTVYFCTSGALLVEGLVLIAVGAAAARRRRSLVAHPGIARLVAVVVTVLFLGPSLTLALVGGYRENTHLYVYATAPDAQSVVLLAIGSVLTVALAAGMRWSGLGAILGGALVAVSGIGLTVVPAVLGGAAARVYAQRVSAPVTDVLPSDLGAALFSAIVGTGLVTVGLVFVCGGVASAVAGRRGSRRSSFVDAHTAEVPSVHASLDEPYRPAV